MKKSQLSREHNNSIELTGREKRMREQDQKLAREAQEAAHNNDIIQLYSITRKSTNRKFHRRAIEINKSLTNKYNYIIYYNI